LKKKILLITSHILVATLSAAIALYLFGGQEYSKLEQLSDLIEAYYVEDVDIIAAEDQAAHAMIASLGDRWSYYIPASEYETHLEQMRNAYVGVGITIMQDQNGVGFEIISVEEGGHAYEVGLLPEDILIAVAGQSVEGMNINEVRNLVRGEEGSYVELTVLRGGEELTFQVERRSLNMTVAKGNLLLDNVGLVVIYNFDDRCAEESIAAIESLREQGVEKLIFDVRYNGGGYAHEMVELLDYLLPEGDLFRTVDYAGRENVDTSDAACLAMPMAVLVNGESFSAAELFAEALREYDAAVVVGERTSGKGYYQNTFELDDGSAVGLSTGKYFTPHGVSLEGVGIIPDVEITVDEETALAIRYEALAPEDDPQLQAAIEALQ